MLQKFAQGLTSTHRLTIDACGAALIGASSIKQCQSSIIRAGTNQIKTWHADDHVEGAAVDDAILALSVFF
jgi:hypothetical protein